MTAAAAGNDEGADRLSLAFARVSRSIRQTIAFAEKRRAKECQAAIEARA